MKQIEWVGREMVLSPDAKTTITISYHGEVPNEKAFRWLVTFFEWKADALTETQRSSSGARSDETTETGEVGVPAEPALTVLRELVACKDLKIERDRPHREWKLGDRGPGSYDWYCWHRDAYEARQPRAWEAARAALAHRSTPEP